MNFFDHQEQARRRTSLLIFLYGLSLVSIAVVIYLALIFLLSGVEKGELELGWKPDLFFWTFAGVLAVIGLGTLYKMVQLSRGGSVVAEMLGGRAISPDTGDPLERRLVNIVEEMALASGTPMPRVYVLDQEPGINAFAAGLTTRDAVVAVTRGALERLNRDELQGVIAHEFSHIHNGDMRLNLRLMGILNGILLLSLIGYYMMRVTSLMGQGRGSGRRGGKEGGAIVLVIFLLGLTLWLIGLIGVFFANLIKSAVSRQREYLADASAVQFTRNPVGLANALKKIGALGKAGAWRAERAAEASHLFFSGGLRAGLFNLFSTHPPLTERIRRLDPTFQGRFDPSMLEVPVAPEGDGSVPSLGMDTEGEAMVGVSAFRGTVAGRKKIKVKGLAEKTGAFSADALQLVSVFIERLSPSLRQAMQRPGEASGVIWALLWAAAQARGEEGIGEWLGMQEGEVVKERVGTLVPAVMQTPRAGWMIVAVATVPALREMAPEVYARFRQNINTAITLDDRITLFEYAMLRFLTRRLDGYFGLASSRGGSDLDLESCRGECMVLLGTLARLGEGREEEIAEAFSAGWAVLNLGSATLPSEAQCTLEESDRALERLARLRPVAKQLLLKACEECAGRDGEITVDEADFLWAVADALECPMPPLALTGIFAEEG